MKIHTNFFSFLLIFIAAAQCIPKKSNQEETVQGIQPIYALEKVWATDSVLKTPESVIYDQDRDVLYVANVNENPWEKDGNGFISKVSTSGKVLDLEWISGFSGPKGMAIVDNILFVADIDEIGLIDIEKGELLEMIPVNGASGLNDITPDLKGGVYISDSNEGKIYHYSGGNISTLHEDAPGRPNGLLVDQGKLLVAFSQAADFASYELGTKEKSIITNSIGSGDGITQTNENETYLVSDWQGEVFVIYPDGTKQSLLKTKNQGKNTADIWFIQEKELLLIPTFFDNRVVAYKLVKG